MNVSLSEILMSGYPAFRWDVIESGCEEWDTLAEPDAASITVFAVEVVQEIQL